MLISIAAQNKSLDANYGPGKAAGMPASHQLALFAGDPAQSGVEISGGGYARVTIPNDATGWPNAAAGGGKTSMVCALPTSTGAWSGTATHWCLISGSDRWDSGALDQEYQIYGSGYDIQVTVTVVYQQA